MIIGKVKGESVQDAKLKVHEAIIKAESAFPYRARRISHLAQRGRMCCPGGLRRAFVLRLKGMAHLIELFFFSEPKLENSLLEKMNIYSPETRHAYQKINGHVRVPTIWAQNYPGILIFGSNL